MTSISHPKPPKMPRLMMEEDINLVTLGAVFSAMQKGECWEQSIEMLDRLPQKTKAGFFFGFSSLKGREVAAN